MYSNFCAAQISEITDEQRKRSNSVSVRCHKCQIVVFVKEVKIVANIGAQKSVVIQSVLKFNRT